MPRYQVEATIETSYVIKIQAESVEDALEKAEELAKDRDWTRWTAMPDDLSDIWVNEIGPTE
jgi:hypothetical protein